jgi:molybdate/tungstate transport system substrate-binding protein
MAARSLAVPGLLLWFLAALPAPPAKAGQLPSGRLVVYNAGSLAAPFRDLLQAFAQRHPGVTVVQESSGSLEAARKLTELNRIPDVLGVADYAVIPSLLVPRFAGWYLGFGRNAMVLAYSDRSTGAREISAANWWRILLRPGVRAGRSDPALDPNGYRTLMVYQLAERHYREPRLAARLLAASPPRYMRPKEADLVALLQAGELDYIWSYRSLAEVMRLPYVALPPEIDLSDPERAGDYARAVVRLPRLHRASTDSLEFRGEPIVYGLAIPRAAPNPAAAQAFVRFMLSPAGQAILRRNGFVVMDRPVVGGPERPPRDIFPPASNPFPSPRAAR